MDRSNLADYLSGQFASLITAAGTCANDDLSGFGPALDAVMVQLGLAVQAVDGDPTITAGLEADATLLTRYYALDWLLGLFALQVDVKTADQSEANSQRFKALTAELARIKAQVPSKYALEPGDFEYGRLQLDFNAPFYGPFGPGLYPWG